MFQTNRRNMLATTGAAITAATLGHRRQILAAAQTNVIETKVISHQANSYCGWPTIVRRKNGQLLVVYSGGRVAHVCPFGRVELICSRDDGDTWSWPRVLLAAMRVFWKRIKGPCWLPRSRPSTIPKNSGGPSQTKRHDTESGRPPITV